MRQKFKFASLEGLFYSVDTQAIIILQNYGQALSFFNQAMTYICTDMSISKESALQELQG